MKLPDPRADPDARRSAVIGPYRPRPGGIEMSRPPLQPTPAPTAAASESPTNVRPALVPINPGMVAPEPPAPTVVPASAPPPGGVAAPARAAPHPQAQASPAQAAPLRGVVTGPNGEQAVFLSDEEVDSEFLKESHTLYVGIASVCSGLFLIIYAGIGMVGAGPLGGIGLAVLGAVLLGVSAAVGTGAAWIAGKLFGEDFGAFHILPRQAPPRRPPPDPRSTSRSRWRHACLSV